MAVGDCKGSNERMASLKNCYHQKIFIGSKSSEKTKYCSMNKNTAELFLEMVGVITNATVTGRTIPSNLRKMSP